MYIFLSLLELNGDIPFINGISFLFFWFTHFSWHHLFTLKILCLFTIEFENASLQLKKKFCTFCCFFLNKYLNKSLFRKT